MSEGENEYIVRQMEKDVERSWNNLICKHHNKASCIKPNMNCDGKMNFLSPLSCKVFKLHCEKYDPTDGRASTNKEFEIHAGQCGLRCALEDNDGLPPQECDATAHFNYDGVDTPSSACIQFPHDKIVGWIVCPHLRLLPFKYRTAEEHEKANAGRLQIEIEDGKPCPICGTIMEDCCDECGDGTPVPYTYCPRCGEVD